MLCHFVTAAEANPRFCNMAMLWAWSIRRRGGALKDSPLTVVFNDRAHEGTAAFLQDQLGVRVEVKPRVSIVHPEANKYNALLADGLDRADWTVLTDCDIAAANDLEPLAAWMRTDAEFGAVPVGWTPHASERKPRGWSPIRRFDRLLKREAGLTAAELRAHEHPWFIDRHPRTRYPHFNGGFFAIRSARVAEFHREISAMSDRLHRRVRRHQWNIARMLVRGWNARVDRTPWADRLTIGSFYRARAADQISIAVVMLKMRLRYTVLPHSFNWRCLGLGHGEELPIRLLHYNAGVGDVDEARLFDGAWIDVFARDENPGRRALAELVTQCRAEFPAIHTIAPPAATPAATPAAPPAMPPASAAKPR